MITAAATLTETISVTASLGGSVCLPATYTLVDTDTPPNTLDSGSIAAGAAETIVAPAATLQQNTIQRKLIPSGTPFNLITKLNGVADNGVWNGVDTIDFTSPACADANLEINGVQQETIASGGTFNLIATLDGVAGGSYNAGTNTLSFTSNTGWQPDPNWPVLPSLTAADERFVGVVAVFENAYNVVTHRITAGAANINLRLIRNCWIVISPTDSPRFYAWLRSSLTKMVIGCKFAS